jgi:hypothetical protein
MIVVPARLESGVTPSTQPSSMGQQELGTVYSLHLRCHQRRTLSHCPADSDTT